MSTLIKDNLPDDAKLYLTPDNPRLLELQRRYEAFDSDVTTPFIWTDQHVRPEDIAYFRGDNAWLWQLRGKNANITSYVVSTYYVKSIDNLNLLDRLTEDNCFGNFALEIAGHWISRDLLDSILEIYFLDRHLEISSRENFRILDVGAGYGRLAHRMACALPRLDKILCTDAIAVSTFVSDYYLKFRRVTKAVVVPLDEIEGTLRTTHVDLAINIHSFSECRPLAIEWWARMLSKHRVRYLMIAPNGYGDCLRNLLTNDRYDFLPLLEKHGYQTVLKEPKFIDPLVQLCGLLPTYYHLLELSA